MDYVEINGYERRAPTIETRGKKMEMRKINEMSPYVGLDARLNEILKFQNFANTKESFVWPYHVAQGEQLVKCMRRTYRKT